MSLDNVISIEENAQYLLKSSSDLRRDEDISSAVIYQDLKYKRGYQPLLTSPHPVNHTFTHFDYHQEEDVLLNPNQYKSTMSIGGQSYSFADDLCSEPKAARGLMTPSVAASPGLASPLIKTHPDYIKHSEWSTSNWTSIFVHFHTVQHDQFIYPCVMLIGILFIIIIMFLELFIIPPSSFIFCRYLNWVLLLLFFYIVAFVISYSKLSTKRWCIIRDHLYIVFWINSLIAISLGIAMKCLPFVETDIANNLKYVNCANGDYNCDRYKTKYGLTESEMDVFMVISHSIPFVYCISMSILFAHKYAFQRPCRELMMVVSIAICWCSWNVISYLVTDKWTYKGMNKVYIHSVWIMCIVLSVVVCITCISYCICYQLHHHCKCCKNNYLKYFKPKTLVAKMKEKERELDDLPDRDDAFSSGIAL